MAKKPLPGPPARVLEKIEREKAAQDKAASRNRHHKKIYMREYHKEYYARNRDKILEKNAKWYKNNQGKSAEYSAKWDKTHREQRASYRKKNRHKINITINAWKNNNKCKVAQSRRECREANYIARTNYERQVREKYVKDVADTYVRQIILASYGIPASKVPPELIELKRTIIKVKRELKGKQNDLQR